MLRSDAFGTALCAVEDEKTAYPDVNFEYLEILREEHRRAHEGFMAYRAELGRRLLHPPGVGGTDVRILLRRPSEAPKSLFAKLSTRTPAWSHRVSPDARIRSCRRGRRTGQDLP